MVHIIIEIEIIEEPLTWLKNSSDPWYMVEEYWKITRSFQVREVLNSQTKKSVCDYMKDYPCLKKPSGYTLVN